MKIHTGTRMALSITAELFIGMCTTVAGGMVVQGQATVPTSWPLLLLLGGVIGLGRAWAEVKAWTEKLGGT